MKVALFSDVHGHLRIVLHLIRNWQIAHSARIDAAVIAGDLGCYPDPSKFDKATRRWIGPDPEEAGFSKFFTSSFPEIGRLFEPEFGGFSSVRCPILFVPGNHEDYAFLTAASKKTAAEGAPANTFPVDYYQRFHCIHDGTVATIRGVAAVSLRIAGLWGIENARSNAPYKIKVAAAQMLQGRGADSFDLFLTHDSPAEAYPLGGSNSITQVIRQCRPKFHVFGHVHPIHGRHDFSVPHSQTKSLVFKGVSFGKDDSLAGSMGILECGASEPTVEIVKDDWLTQMRFKTWEQVLPKQVLDHPVS